MDEAPDASGPSAYRDALALLGLLVLAGGLRTIAWSRTEVLFNDGPVFLALAEALAEGRIAEVLAHPFHPLYPAAVALVAPAFGRLEDAAAAISIFGGLLSVVAVYAFARARFDRGIAWMSGWTVALHPWAVDFSSDVMSDGLYIGLFAVGFALMIEVVERPAAPRTIVLGGVAGLAYLTRPEGAGLVALTLLLLAARGVREPARRPAVARAGLGLGLAAAVTMAPLLVPLALETGELRLTRKKAVTALVTGDTGLRLADSDGLLGLRGSADAAPLPLPRSAERVGGGGARRPERSVGGAFEALSRALRTSLAALRYEVALFAAVGLWLTWRRGAGWREGCVLLTATLYTGVLVLLVWGAGYVARRHALAALLPLMVYAALGWRALHRALVDRALAGSGERVRRWKKPRPICVGLVVVLCLVWGARDLRPRRVDRIALRTAAQWLAEQEASGAVAAQKLRVAYYARAPFVPLPSGRHQPLESALRSKGVRWIVIDEARLDDHEGLVAGLGGWLLPIHRVERAGQRAVVLEVRPAPAR